MVYEITRDLPLKPIEIETPNLSVHRFMNWLKKL